MDDWIPILIAPVALAALIAGLLYADAMTRGWRRIASRCAAPGERPDAARQDGAVGSSALLQLRGLLRAAATDEGLYIATPRWLRFTHPPLLIPWNQMSVREEQRRLGVPTVTLSVGRMHLGFITLRGGVAGDVLERLSS